jgi:putative membrane protein
MSGRSIRIALFGLLACLPASFARADLSAGDKKFVEKAATGGLMEVDLGRLASEKASTDEAKQFGQQMVTDHSKANDELKKLAQDKGVDLKQAESKATSQGQATKDKLSKYNGVAFDKAYMDDMVKDHTKDVKEFEDESKKAQDADLKSWVEKTLPTLQEHLKMAKAAQEKLKKTAQ